MAFCETPAPAMAFGDTPAPSPMVSRALTSAPYECPRSKESPLPALFSGKLLWTHYPPHLVAEATLDPAKRKGVLRNIYRATGLLGHVQDAQARSSAKHAAVDRWLDQKQQEREAHANSFAGDPQWKALTEELAYWKHVTRKPQTAAQLAHAEAAIREIYDTFAERNAVLEQADVAVRAEVAGALVALTRGGCPRSQRAVHPMAPLPRQQQPTVEGSVLLFGRPECEPPKAPSKVEIDLRGTRLSRNNAPGAFKFKLSIDDRPTLQQRFEWYVEHGADVDGDGRAEAMAPARAFKIEVPEWFHQLEYDGRVSSNEPTSEGRFRSLCNTLHRLEADMRLEEEDEKKKERAKEKKKMRTKAKTPEGLAADADKGTGAAWDKQFHEPHAGWRHPVQQKRGGWWKCRTGADATEAERRCHLCHRGDKPRPGQDQQPRPPPPPRSGKAKEDYNAFMAMVEEAMSKVGRWDRAEIENEDEQRQRERERDDRMRMSTWDLAELAELAEDERMRACSQGLLPEQEQEQDPSPSKSACAVRRSQKAQEFSSSDS